MKTQKRGTFRYQIGKHKKVTTIILLIKTKESCEGQLQEDAVLNCTCIPRI